MRVTFYGVRGSVPAPGPSTVRYGGNTSCVSVELSDGGRLILDAGTGIRTLGNDLLKAGGAVRTSLLLSHTHWDHVLGLPFFGPLWKKDTELHIYPLISEAQERFQRTIFDDIHFPVSAQDIPANVSFERPDAECWNIGAAKVTRIALNHPGGSQGFRIEDADGTKLAYLTDNELAADPNDSALQALARFSDDVDLLIHDSQYLTHDMPAKSGWGHSVVDDVLRLGKLAEPKRLALFHHDPDRRDDELDAIGTRAAAWLKDNAAMTQVVVACEGLSFDL
ncbi:MAG: MBL fold metallo-hydrolase [Polyangiaceae bacterium]